MIASRPSPELSKHLRAIEESNRAYRDWIAGEAGDADDVRFNEIRTLCNIAASHGISAGEAAYRQDQNLLGEHLRHAREALVLALKAFNALGSGQDEDKRAA